MEETAWNSETFKITYTVFGWIAFVVWSSSFYPQFILNYSRKRYNHFISYYFSFSLESKFSLCGKLEIVVWWD